MDPDRLGDWLKQERIITIKEWQENIASSVNIKDQRRSTLEYLSTILHPRAYIILRQVLIQDNPRIARAIDNATSEAEKIYDVLNQIIKHHEFLIERMDSKFGLLHSLRAIGILRNEELEEIQNETTQRRLNGRLLDCISMNSSRNSADLFIEALKETDQGHLVNYIISDGVYYSKFADEWPLTETDIRSIDSNSETLVDLLDTDALLQMLYASDVINRRQREFISSKPTLCKRNECLLEILRNTSKRNYKETILCLHKSNQNRIAEILVTGEDFSIRFESCIIVAGFNNDEEIGRDVVKIKLNGTNEVYNIEPFPSQMGNESASAVYGNSLFVTGVGENPDKIWKFDARSSKWEYCNSMIRGRRRHSVAFVDHVLYICGGCMGGGEIALIDVEAYDTIEDRCTTVGKLVRAVQNAGNCVPFKSSLYIFGGCDANGVIVDYVQVYDTKLNSCTLLSNRMPVPRGFLRAALWENKAILLTSNTCLIYNFNTRTWQQRDQFKTGVLHFGFTLHNGKLFVIGGGEYNKDVDGNVKWIFRDDVRSVPVENVLNNESIEWLHHAKLPKPTTVSNFGKMEFSAQ